MKKTVENLEADLYSEIEPPVLEVAEPVVAYDFGSEPSSALVSLLAERLADFERSGGSFSRLGGVEAVAERMMSTLPRSSPWNEALGPFHTTAQVARILGDISRQAIAARRANDSLVALRTGDAHWVYPAFQFDLGRGLIPGVAELWSELVRCGEERWTLARWFVSAQEVLDGRSLVDALRDGEPIETLRPLVQEAARRFAV